MSIRAEVLQQVLNEAEKAKPIEGTRNTYDPNDYQKIRMRQEAMAMINTANNDGYLEPQIGEGAIEFDERGNLKRIGRAEPKLIDTRRLTANRYAKVTVKVGTLGLKGGTDILFVFGGAAVRAFENTTLTPQVKVYRFHYNATKKDWEYVRAELVEDKYAYATMTNSLNGASALQLIHKIEQDVVKSADVEGDDLGMILTKKEKVDKGEDVVEPVEDEIPSEIPVEIPSGDDLNVIK